MINIFFLQTLKERIVKLYDDTHAYIVFVCVCACISLPLCSLFVMSLLWIEDQSPSINETREGIWRDPLHLQQIIFQVD